MAEHWDGRRWQRVLGPHASRRGIFYDSVAAGGRVLAVGDQSQPHTTLIAERTGMRWMVTPTQLGSLSAVAATTAGTVWAVGAVGTRPLILRCTPKPG